MRTKIPFEWLIWRCRCSREKRRHSIWPPLPNRPILFMSCNGILETLWSSSWKRKAVQTTTWKWPETGASFCGHFVVCVLQWHETCYLCWRAYIWTGEGWRGGQMPILATSNPPACLRPTRLTSTSQPPQHTRLKHSSSYDLLSSTQSYYSVGWFPFGFSPHWILRMCGVKIMYLGYSTAVINSLCYLVALCDNCTSQHKGFQIQKIFFVLYIILALACV